MPISAADSVGTRVCCCASAHVACERVLPSLVTDGAWLVLSPPCFVGYSRVCCPHLPSLSSLRLLRFRPCRAQRHPLHSVPAAGCRGHRDGWASVPGRLCPPHLPGGRGRSRSLLSRSRPCSHCAFLWTFA